MLLQNDDEEEDNEEKSNGEINIELVNVIYAISTIGELWAGVYLHC